MPGNECLGVACVPSFLLTLLELVVSAVVSVEMEVEMKAAFDRFLSAQIDYDETEDLGLPSTNKGETLKKGYVGTKPLHDQA